MTERTPRENGNENEGKQNTRSYKHVQIEHKRPQLKRTEAAQELAGEVSQANAASAKAQRSSSRGRG
ncbi:MAG: hypothetical protein RR666_02290, partial [Raoultibacter sp.]